MFAEEAHPPTVWHLRPDRPEIGEWFCTGDVEPAETKGCIICSTPTGNHSFLPAYAKDAGAIERIIEMFPPHARSLIVRDTDSELRILIPFCDRHRYTADHLDQKTSHEVITTAIVDIVLRC